MMKKCQFLAIFAGLSMFCGCTLENACSSNEERCIEEGGEAYVESCVDGLWKRESNPCASGLCNEAQDACLATVCVTDETECDPTRGVRKCDAHGQWGEYSQCEAGVGCTGDGKSCAECMSGEPYCDGAIMKICLQGKVNIIPDITGYCKSCTEGSKECSGPDKYKECHNGEWSEVSCGSGELCSKGQCTTAGCKPAETVCAGGRLTTCLESSEWGETKDCETGNCKSGTECGECRDDGASCSNNNDGLGVLRICLGGVEMEVVCGTSCKDDASDCGRCINDDTSCRDGVLKKCVNGDWDEGRKCEYGCEDGGKSCKSSGTVEPVECKGTAQKCVDSKIFSCQDGYWVQKSSCTNGCNESGTDCADKPLVCLEGEKKCENNDGGNGVLYECQKGVYKAINSCAKASCCNNMCGTCLNDTTQCTNNTETTCKNGLWTDEIKCEYGCDGDKCGTRGGDIGCEIGATRCLTNNTDGRGNLETCTQSGDWKGSFCDYSCNSDQTDCGECLNGKTKCENDLTGTGGVKICANGTFTGSMVRSCDVYSCNSDMTGCGVCKDGETSCIENVVNICTNGAWKATLETGCSVINECIDGQTRCQSNDRIAGYGILETCSNGTWIPQGCGNANSCDTANNKCGECVNDRYCSVLGIRNSCRLCQNGVWGSSTVECPGIGSVASCPVSGHEGDPEIELPELPSVPGL